MKIESLRNYAAILALGLSVVIGGCGKRLGVGSVEPLSEAARAVERGSRDARQLALAAWEAWLFHSDAERFRELALRAVEREPGEPWALLALAEGAKRDLDREAEAEAWLQLLERLPEHPLGALAAQELGSLAGASLEGDERLREASARLLAERTLLPETRVRLWDLRRRLVAGRGGNAFDEAVSEAGLLREAAVVGPLSAYRFLERGRSFEAFEKGPLPAADYRAFSLPSGHLSLAPESAKGDLFYALSVATVPRKGRYLLRMETAASTSASLYVDGREVLARTAFGAMEPTRLGAEIELSAGEHLIALKLFRGNGAGDAAVQLLPLAGSEAPTFRAAAPGDVARSGAVVVRGPAMESAGALAGRLGEEGGVLAAWAGARYGSSGDVEGARILIEDAVGALRASAPLLTLRAELTLRDETLPRSVSEGRAAADLEASLAQDPRYARALWLAARMLQSARRDDEAEERLELAEEVAPGAAPLENARARLARSRGLDARAVELARALLEDRGGDCDAASLIYMDARSRRAVAEQEEIARRYVGCPGGKQRLADWFAGMGRREEALALAWELFEEDPQSLRLGFRLADLLSTTGDPGKAAAVLESLEAVWPRNAELPRRRAEFLLLAGDEEAARKARERALSMGTGDLMLLRAESALRGEEPLSAYDKDGLEIVAEFDASARSYDAPSVVLFDFAAVEVFPDGSMLERVHMLVRILDRRGVDRHGEAYIPAGAEVLQLRTIKQDGRLLEPEAIGGKDSVSLPNLDVGDTVEIAYLTMRPARGPSLAGWSATPFTFRMAQEPVVEALYVVRVPKGIDIEVDTHNGAPLGEWFDEGDARVYRVHVEEIPAFIPEPASVASAEILPWVQVGAGAGEREMACSVADSLEGSLRWNRDVAQWARRAVADAGPEPLARIRALWDAVMEEVEGDDPSFLAPASHVLAHGRGNRLLLLQAALDELGIENQFALVRTFDRDPSARRFPEPRLWGRVLLVVRPSPQDGLLWLDPTVRWAPFGALEPGVQGSAAWILPRAGEEEPTCLPGRTPAPDEEVGESVTLYLELQPDGSLVGEGVDRYRGIHAAYARNNLERMGEEARMQAVETNLSESFRGLVLDALSMEFEKDETVLRYAFHVPSFLHAAPAGGLLFDLDFTRANLAQRTLHRGERETPLLLRTPERTVLEVEIVLPPGFAVRELPEAGRELSPYGNFRRAVALRDGLVALRDELHVERGRIAPLEYADFAAWVNAVDRAQISDLILELVAQPIVPQESPEEEGKSEGGEAQAFLR